MYYEIGLHIIQRNICFYVYNTNVGMFDLMQVKVEGVMIYSTFDI